VRVATGLDQVLKFLPHLAGIVVADASAGFGMSGYELRSENFDHLSAITKAQPLIRTTVFPGTLDSDQPPKALSSQF
jgi:hypothetical protein